MFLNFNHTAMTAFRNYTIHNNAVSKSLERLSSGKRINRAADDPAGMAIAERLKLKLTLLGTDRSKVQDAMSRIDIADGLMGETSSMLNRMYELAQQAANGTYSDTERAAMDAEYQQLLDEINRTGKSEYLAPTKLFQSPTDIQAETDLSTTITGQNLDAFLDGLDQFLLDVSAAAKSGDDQTLLELGIDRSNGQTDGENLKQAIWQFTVTKGEQLLNTPLSGSGKSKGDFEVTLADGNISVKMPTINDQSLGLAGSNLNSQDSARQAMEAVKKAISSVSASRGSLGGTYNRLNHTLNNIATMEVNLTESLSRIEDVDMAKEMMNLVKEQVLAQASVFAMAQANQQPNQVLSLIKSL